MPIPVCTRVQGRAHYHVHDWLAEGRWLRGLEQEGSLDYVASGLPRRGDIIDGAQFLDNASPWSFWAVIRIGTSRSVAPRITAVLKSRAQAGRAMGFERRMADRELVRPGRIPGSSRALGAAILGPGTMSTWTCGTQAQPHADIDSVPTRVARFRLNGRMIVFPYRGVVVGVGGRRMRVGGAPRSVSMRQLGNVNDQC
jgi:hypothetical protein